MNLLLIYTAVVGWGAAGVAILLLARAMKAWADAVEGRDEAIASLHEAIDTLNAARSSAAKQIRRLRIQLNELHAHIENAARSN